MKTIIGVMGPGNQATPADTKTAYALGNAIATAGWVLLTGGRNAGVMDAASRGAKNAGGITIGILPDNHLANMSDAVDIPIVTGLGNGRNIINVLTSHILIACGHGAGTTSEIALALKVGKPIIWVNPSRSDLTFWQTLCASPLVTAQTADEVVALVRECLSQQTS